MKTIKKSVAFLLVAFLAFYAFENVGVNAGAFTEAEYIGEYTPEFKVEAMMDNTAIKVTIPEQAYIKKTNSFGPYYPQGYEITLLDVSDDTVNTQEFTDSLYGTYYNNIPKGGYGPYGINTDSKVGKAQVIQEDGTKDRTYVYTDLDPGKYVVRLRAYAVGDFEYVYIDKDGNEEYRYDTGIKYWSVAAEEKISLNEKKSAEIKIGYKKKYDFSKVKKGDTIKFGSYEQDGNIMNGREPIEWIVLEKTKKQMLVVSKNNLDKLPYNSGREPVTWADSSLRLWLNDSFYNAAFNKSEQKLISLTTLKNKANPSTGVSAGKNTKDKVFVLSLQDVTNSSYGFSKKILTHDAMRRSVYGFDENLGGRWWLRTPAYDQSHVLFVGSEGGLEYEYGMSLTSWSASSLGVRPALYIKLK